MDSRFGSRENNSFFIYLFDVIEYVQQYRLSTATHCKYKYINK